MQSKMYGENGGVRSSENFINEIEMSLRLDEMGNKLVYYSK